MPNIGSTEIIVLLLVLVLLFGATRLPKAAEGIGKSLKVFKREIRSSQEEDEAQAVSDGQAGTAQSATGQDSQQVGGQATETAPSSNGATASESTPATQQQNN